jgi:hypothetical protein
MEYGVFTSAALEIANTRYWALCLYCNSDKSIIGAKLYNGVDENKTLAAICERDSLKKLTVYAYEKPDGQRYTNDSDGVFKLLGGQYQYALHDLKKIDDIELTEQYKMPSVTEAGIKKCLKEWRMGSFFREIYNGILFQMVTDKIEYVFQIRQDKCDIYCGASVNIPYDEGMFGSGQYFRLRNFDDNSAPYCKFYCNIGNDAIIREVPDFKCESGKCVSTADGLYWQLKRHSDNEIVLTGCGGDEYIYRNDAPKSEYFKTR